MESNLNVKMPKQSSKNVIRIKGQERWIINQRIEDNLQAKIPEDSTS